jgi:hypothetical protein
LSRIYFTKQNPQDIDTSWGLLFPPAIEDVFLILSKKENKKVLNVSPFVSPFTYPSIKKPCKSMTYRAKLLTFAVWTGLTN